MLALLADVSPGFAAGLVGTRQRPCVNIEFWYRLHRHLLCATEDENHDASGYRVRISVL